MLQKLFSRMQGKATKENKIPLLFPLGHFYSPVADPEELRVREAKLWAHRNDMLGIAMHAQKQLQLLKQLAPFVSSISWPDEQLTTNKYSYFYQNDQFPMLDAEVLFSMLCHIKPRNMIEVGSGFSSLVTAEVNRNILNNSMHFTCIEPYPRQFLLDGVPGITSLVIQKVEDIDIVFFDKLEANDILFIDSSHVSKVGSDVNYLFFEIIPRLKKCVYVHFHDIFLPDEYPKKWAIEEGRNWNEQYILRAFLQHNSAWEVVWAAHFMGTRHASDVYEAFPRFTNKGGGGSFWIRKRS
jgi:hypothetical protein